jgi:3-hydroxyisobutyrate dehydrogenase
MAGQILAAGHSLTVHNRTRAKMSELVERGAVAADSPAEVAAKSELIVTMVSDTPDVEEVIAGPSGVLEGVQEGAIVVDMSTIAPATERRLDEKLRKVGCSLIDAPVSGGDIGARQGTLAIMAGGDPGAFERARPVLELMGKQVTHCGPVGSGQVTKLCNQILVSVTLLGVSEALLFARKSGLDPLIMIKAVEGGSAGSWQLANLGPRIERRDFAPGFMIDLMQKDLRLILQAGEESGTPLPAASMVRQLLLSAQARGEGREGTQSLAKVLERMAQSG